MPQPARWRAPHVLAAVFLVNMHNLADPIDAALGHCHGNQVWPLAGDRRDWRHEAATRPHYRHRFPAEIISHAVWLYHVFSLSLRDVELLLAERGIVVSYETVRRWCKKFGESFRRPPAPPPAAAGGQVAPGRCVTNTSSEKEVWSCTRDEGRPFEVGSQVLVSSHCKLLSSKAMVVSVAETAGRDPGRQGWRGERKRTADEVSKAIRRCQNRGCDPSSGISSGDALKTARAASGM